MAESLRDTIEHYDANNREEVGKYTMSVAVMLTGVEAHRIRRYEQAGLLKPLRSEARQRRYSDHEIDLINNIATLEDERINLRGVKAILAMRRGERK
ncbi:MerR family transcriptional regulator [Chloroflexota bacterium]